MISPPAIFTATARRWRTTIFSTRAFVRTLPPKPSSLRRGAIEVARDRRARAVGRGMRAVVGGVLPDEAGAREIERHERGAHRSEREERGAEVVLETGEGDLARPHRAARFVVRFDDEDVEP